MGQTFIKCLHAQQKQQQLPIEWSLSDEREESLLPVAVPSPLLTEFPTEILIYGIFSYLNYRDLCRLSQTNRYFQNLIETQIEHLWTRCIRDEMLDVFIEKEINVTYVKLNKTVKIYICPYDLVTEICEKIHDAFDKLPELSPHKYQYIHGFDDEILTSGLKTRFFECYKNYNDGKDIKLLVEEKDDGIHATIMSSPVRYDKNKNAFGSLDSSAQQAILQNEKHHFQYLIKRRQHLIDPYTTVYQQCSGCTSVTPFSYTLSHRYITLSPFTNPIQPEKKHYALIVYYRNGNRQNKNQLDEQSFSLVARTFREWLGPNEEHWKNWKPWWPQLEIKILCVKCQRKVDYNKLDCNTSSDQCIQIYNWYKSYPRRKSGRRFEYIEIYCKICERFSLWKTVNPYRYKW